MGLRFKTASLCPERKSISHALYFKVYTHTGVLLSPTFLRSRPSFLSRDPRSTSRVDAHFAFFPLGSDTTNLCAHAQFVSAVLYPCPLWLQVDITDPVLEAIATKYTFEAGCRGMERQLEKICRKVTPPRPAFTDLKHCPSRKKVNGFAAAAPCDISPGTCAMQGRFGSAVERHSFGKSCLVLTNGFSLDALSRLQ
jgi:hypothetical protein